jgi:hypothetical protein
MAVVNGYCTTAELRAWMGDSGTILSADVLEFAINAASRSIDKFCARRFWQDSTLVGRDFRVRDADIVWISDIGDTTGMTVVTDDLADGSFGTLWDADEYELSPYPEDEVTPHAYFRLHTFGRSFPVNDFRRTLRVTAKFGWATVPEQVKQACLMKANILVLRKDSPYGVAGFSEYGVVRLNRTEDPEITRLLAPFVRSEVASI